jgi:hypothetical protein
MLTVSHTHWNHNIMSQNNKPNQGRKPATKFAHLRKKMDQSKVRGNLKQIRRTTNK